MAIILSHPLTVQEIRVLQEFKRLGTETLAITAIKAIKHPAGGGEGPARTLAGKGYLTADANAENFILTDKGREFLAHESKPQTGSSAAAAEGHEE
jgi:hypothetical protein